MALAINERFLLGTSKQWVGCPMYLMIALVENDNWEEIVERCYAHWGTEFFHWFMHSKQIYEPRETLRILLSPEITPLLTKPFLPYYPLRILRAWTMGYKDNTWFCWIFNGLYVGLNIHRALMLILLTTYPLAWLRFLLHVLWSDRDPWCMSSGLTKSRSSSSSFFIFIFIIFYYFFLFLIFGTLGLHGPS